MHDSSDLLKTICEALLNKNIERASQYARSLRLDEGAKPKRRRHPELLKMTVFVGDGFIARYSGPRLFQPAALRIISCRLPNEFPYHPNWKHGHCHPIYWELSATVDHIMPIASKGTDHESNLI